MDVIGHVMLAGKQGERVYRNGNESLLASLY